MNAAPAASVTSTAPGSAIGCANRESPGPGWPSPTPFADVFRALLAREPVDGTLPLGPEILVAAPRAAPAAVAPAVPRASSLSARRGSDDDAVDPLRRHRAALQAAEVLAPAVALTAPPPSSLPGLPASVDAARAPISLEDLLPAFVRRIAWSGDGKRGTVRLEIGAGELAGGTLLVAAEGGRVQVHLTVPAGVDPAAWQARIRRRLESRQILAETVEVT